MRMPTTALALAALLVVAACDREPEPPQTTPAVQRPTPPPQAAQPAPDDTAPPAEQPAERATTTTTAQPAAPAPGQRLYTVQVGAFMSQDSAQKWMGRLRSQGMPVWTSMVETQGRTYYRLRVGVVPTVAEARRLGDMVAQRYNWPVWVAPIAPGERIPDNAVEATRRVMTGD